MHFRPITLTVAKCWDPSPQGYFTLPRSESFQIQFKIELHYIMWFLWGSVYLVLHVDCICCLAHQLDRKYIKREEMLPEVRGFLFPLFLPDEPIRPIDPAAWVSHSVAMTGAYPPYPGSTITSSSSVTETERMYMLYLTPFNVSCYLFWVCQFFLNFLYSKTCFMPIYSDFPYFFKTNDFHIFVSHAVLFVIYW